MRKSVITESLYNDAIDLINNHGYSVRLACEVLDIPRTSFRRMVSNRGGLSLSNDIEYHVLLKSSNYTFIINGDFHTIDKDSAEFNKKKELIESLINRANFKMNLNEQAIIVDGNLNKIVRDVIAKCDNLTVKDGKFYYKNKLIQENLFNIIKESAKKKGVSNINKFVDMLIMNPDESMIYQLHEFIKHNDIEINKDGYVITYKSVRYDWYDHRTKTIFNGIGQVPSMDRDLVDCNPDNTCSNGLHVASMSYIMKLYNNSNNRIMICKVHPKDFCSIPKDYNFAKARVCEYEVIGELE